MNRGDPDVARRARSRVLELLVVAVSLCYLAALVKITLIKGASLPQLARDWLEGRAPLRALNLVPFETIRTYLGMRGSMSVLRRFSNLAGNMLIFVPFGLYLPMIFRRMRKFRATLLVIAASSLCIEALQYLLGTGSTDIDDLWLNTVGGILGFGLFLLVSRPTATAETARWRTLALSACFAMAGYAVAYREFGIYLGLATLRTEVPGGASIPVRPADAIGVVTGRGDRSFVLARFAAPSGGVGEIEVRFGLDTRFFERHGTLSGNTQTFRYVPYAPDSTTPMPLDVIASVWGRRDGERLLADTVWTGRSSGAAPGAPSFTTIRRSAPGLALPSAAPATIGFVKSVAGDEVVINRTREMKMGGRLLAVTGTATDTFHLSAATSFVNQRIERGGREVQLLPGRRADIAKPEMVRVWGRVLNNRLMADVVCVIK